jgi:hypothetical protein
VSLGSCFERSGGLTGIAESGNGVAEGILMCCCFGDGTVRKRVLKFEGGIHMPGLVAGQLRLHLDGLAPNSSYTSIRTTHKHSTHLLLYSMPLVYEE